MKILIMFKVNELFISTYSRMTQTLTPTSLENCHFTTPTEQFIKVLKENDC